MTDYAIPCEVIARLSVIATNAPDHYGPWFQSLRYDNGILLASDHSFLIAEYIGGPDGIFHLIVDPALVAQCQTEGVFKGTLNVTVNDMLKFAVGKTTMGYITPANCVLWQDERSAFDRWREVVARVREPALEPQGGMYWKVDQIANLAKVAPSGSVVFEQVVDVNRPTIVRDPYDENWFAMFNPWNKELDCPPASFPSWMK